MGWKGVVRSIGAAARAAERDAKRRHRQLELQAKHQSKLEALELASYEYEVFCNHVDLLRSVHKDSSDGIDWIATSKLPEPMKPQFDDSGERNAQRKQPHISLPYSIAPLEGRKKLEMSYHAPYFPQKKVI